MKQRLRKLVAMLGIASLVSSQTVTALANEVAVATDVSVVSEKGGEEESELLPIENLRWSEDVIPGYLWFDNPNVSGANILYLFEMFRDGVSLGHIGFTSEEVETGWNFSHEIDESGEYQVKVYLFHGNMEFADAIDNKDAGKCTTSDVYNYVRPENELPYPENIKFNANGILSWDVSDNEFVMVYNVQLLDVTEGYRKYVRNGVWTPQMGEEVAQIDFSDSMEEGKKYAVVFDVYSLDIEQWANNLSSSQANNLDEVIYRAGDEIVEENTLLPVVFEDWKGGTLTFTNPNTEKCWIVKELCKDGEVLASYIPYSSDTLENPLIESWDLQIDEVGDYQLNVYVLPADMTFEAAHLLYKQRGVVSSSPILHYTNTNRLEVPTNITFDENGIVTWSEVENADNFSVHLYEMSNDGTKPRYVEGEFDNDHDNSADFSAVLEAGNEYAISIRVLSHDIFEYAHSEWSELIPMNGTSVEEPSDEVTILPITSAKWDSENPGRVLFENPNPEGVEITYITELYRDGECFVSSHWCGTTPDKWTNKAHNIYEPGNYYTITYMFPGNVEYDDACEMLDTCEYVITSDIYTYERPDVSLSVPDNITLDSNGILSWDVTDKNYTAGYYVALYEINKEAQFTHEKYKCLFAKTENFKWNDKPEKYELDVSDRISENKEYGVMVISLSSNIEVVANQSAISGGSFEEANIIELKITEAEESTGTGEVLPVTNLQWDGANVTFDDPNEENVWLMYAMYRDGEQVATWEGIGTDLETSFEIECAESIDESGAYIGKVYVVSGDYTYEEFKNNYETLGVVSETEVLNYTNPGRLEIPEDFKFLTNGVMTWTEVPYSYCGDAELYDMTTGEPVFVADGRALSWRPSIDLSYYIKDGRTYAVRFKLYSENVFTHGHSVWSDYIYMTEEDKEVDLLPLSNLKWSETEHGVLTYDNPNPKGKNILYYAKFFKDGVQQYSSYGAVNHAPTTDSYAYSIEESGEYYVELYIFPDTYTYEQASALTDTWEYKVTSDVYHYEHPGQVLPLPENITMSANGVISWNSLDNEYVKEYSVDLYEYDEAEDRYMYRAGNNTNSDYLDFSNCVDLDKKYAIAMQIFSSDIEVWGNNLGQGNNWEDNLLYLEPEEETEEEPSTEESSSTVQIEVLPVTDLVWEGTTLHSRNLNTIDVRVLFELYKNGEFVTRVDGICPAGEEGLDVECEEDITESGEYVGKIYVMSADYSYEEFLEKYATEGFVSVSDTLIYTEPESSEPESSEPESSEPESSEPESSEPESSEPESSEPESSEPESSEPESSEPESSSKPESSEPESSEPESSEPESSEPESSEPESSEPESSEPESSEPESSETPESKEPEKKPSSSSNSSSNKSSSSSSSNSSSSSSSTSVTVPKKVVEVVEIIEEIIPLASSIEEAGHAFVDLILTNKNAALSVNQLSKYFGKDMLLQAHLGNGVGYTIDANTLSKDNATMNISAELKQLDTFAEGFDTFHVKPAKNADLGQEVGLHINVGQEYEGKKAYIYAKNITTGELEFVGAWTVNSIGNIGFYTNTMTDVVVMIEN